MNDISNAPTKELRGVNALVVGILAAMYSNSTDSAPVRYWGRADYRQAVRVGNDRYACGREVLSIDGGPKEICISLRVDRNHYGGGEPHSEDYLIPAKSLESIDVQFGAS